jgi:hypothetical protein
MNLLSQYLLVLGYSNEAPITPKRYREERVHYDGW